MTAHIIRNIQFTTPVARTATPQDPGKSGNEAVLDLKLMFPDASPWDTIETPPLSLNHCGSAADLAVSITKNTGTASADSVQLLSALTEGGSWTFVPLITEGQQGAVGVISDEVSSFEAITSPEALAHLGPDGRIKAYIALDKSMASHKTFVVTLTMLRRPTVKRASSD